MLRENNPTNETYEKINEWLETYHTSDNLKEKEKAKALIVTNMYPVVKTIARTIARRAYDPIEDLTQAGFIGLLKAIDRYNPEINDNFRVYAGYLIIGEIKHFIRDRLNSIKIPRYIQELSIRINKFIETLNDEEVKFITSKKIAKALSLNESIVDITMEADRRKNTIPLQDAFNIYNDNMTYEDFLTDGDYLEKAEYEDTRILYDDIIEKLPPESKVLIEMFYKQDMSKREIAKALVLSEMSINRRLKQTFELIAELIAEKKNEQEKYNKDIEE